MRRAFFCLLLTAGMMNAQGPLVPPVVGLLHRADGALRPLFGVRGNYLLGDRISEDVESAAFAGSLGLIKTSTALILAGPGGEPVARYTTSPGPAILGVSNSREEAAAWLPASGELVVWSGGRRVATQRAALDRVVAVAPAGGDSVLVAVAEDGGVRLLNLRRRRRMTLEREFLPGLQAPVWIDSGGSVICAQGNQLYYRDPHGAGATLPLGHRLTAIEPVADEVWRLVLEAPAATDLLLVLRGGTPTVYHLPGGDR
jgi:hypothetical protein